MTDIFVFGYGSLLDQQDAERTVSDIEYLYNALLPSHKVACTRSSKTRDGGVADVVPHDECDVWGAVYRVNEAGLRSLDNREGVQNQIYCRNTMTVFRDGDKNKPVKVEVYTVVNKSKHPIPCTNEYRDLILRGAEDRHLPDDYIRLLRSDLKVHTLDHNGYAR